MVGRSFVICDIETRVDKSLIQQTRYPHLTEQDAYLRYKQQLRGESQGRSDLIPVTYHVPISIAVGYVDPDYTLRTVETLAYPRDGANGTRPGETPDLFGEAPASAVHGASGASIERAMVEEFWRLAQDGHTLVTFNGRAFDLPVLELAALRYGVQAPKHFNEKYGARFRYSEEGHYDLCDVLSNAGAARLTGGLNALMGMLGYVGKDGVDGSMVQDLWEQGKHEIIHAYCRRDVICTYALFIRLELIHGRMAREQYAQACHQSASFLARIR